MTQLITFAIDIRDYVVYVFAVSGDYGTVRLAGCAAPRPAITQMGGARVQRKIRKMIELRPQFQVWGVTSKDDD